MPDRPIKVALIGCGAVSRLFYGPAMREAMRLREIEVVAVADPAPAGRSALGNLFPKACQHEDPSGAFAGGDLAIIASPPHFHRTQTEQALAAGLHVLCEKPVAASSIDAEAMVAAARSAGRILAVGHYKRFFPVHRLIKQLIESRSFGALRSLDIAEGGKFGWPAASDSFFREDITPGGVFYDIGPHVLDLLLWWLGSPVKSKYQDDAGSGGLEANAYLSAQWDTGVEAAVHLSRDWETPNRAVLRFDAATAIVRTNAANRIEWTLDGVPVTLASELRSPVEPFFALETSPLDSNPQAFVRQLLDVCRAVRQSSRPEVAGEDGIAVMRWIERCYAQRGLRASPDPV